MCVALVLQANDWVKNSTQMFVKQLFPSLRPTGRREAVVRHVLFVVCVCVWRMSLRQVLFLCASARAYVPDMCVRFWVNICAPVLEQMLSELLDRLMAGFEAHKGTMPPRELIKESQKIHSMCMFELVRQVTVQCGERGVLLKRIWE